MEFSKYITDLHRKDLTTLADTSYTFKQPNKSSTKSHNMPRNGDGSGDNGPIEGNDVIHGNSGDVRPSIHSPKNHINIPQTTLQHVKNNIAPMPEIEKGEGNSNQSRSNERNAKQTKPSRA
jgi:hypothetical protein